MQARAAAKMAAQSGGGNDEAAQWKVDFAPSDCAHVTLQNVASGKFMNFDENSPEFPMIAIASPEDTYWPTSLNKVELCL